jgi:hypothetical protein
MIRLCDPARDGGGRPFRDLGRRPIRLGGRVFDMLTALIEASLAVVCKDEHLSRAWQGRIVAENRQPGTIFPRCAGALAPTAS